MNIAQLTYFVTVAEVLNLHKAADLLFISQSALSQSLSKLETEVSATLFNRDGHRLSLTKYGAVYYQRAKMILAELETANFELRHMVDTHTGIVDLAYIPTLQHRFLPEFINSFHNHSSNGLCHFHLYSDISSNITQGVLNQKYDLGFVSRSFDNPDLELIQAFATEIVIIVPIDHPLAVYDEVDIQALNGLPFIGYQRKSGLFIPILNIIKNNNLQIDYIMTALEEDSIADMVEYGFGVSIVAQNMYLENKKIKQIHIKGPRYCRIVNLIYHRNTYHTEPVKEVIDYIREECIPHWMPDSIANLGNDYHVIL